MKIFIPFNVPSSKNSKRWTGKFLISSQLVLDYIKDTKVHFEDFAEEFRSAYDSLPKPVYIGFKFYRDSRREFDYINAAQIVLDLMQDPIERTSRKTGKKKTSIGYGLIPRDNADNVIPVFLPYEYNKEVPGVTISIISSCDILFYERGK